MAACLEPLVRLVPTPVACQLTGLSTAKLREWTTRRALFSSDVPPRGKGSPASFSWQTILVLRLAVLLRERFAVELECHRPGFKALRARLATTSFIGLWGMSAALTADGQWSLLEESAAAPEDALLLLLDPHLTVIRDGFALPGDTVAQLDLFSLPAVHSLAGRGTSPSRARKAA